MNKKVAIIFLLVALSFAFFYYFYAKSNSINIGGLEGSSSNSARKVSSNKSNVNNGNSLNQTKEVNISRGIFASYANDQVAYTSIDGKTSLIAANPNKMMISCVGEYKVNSEGKRYSLYDSYINVDKFHLESGSRLFSDEKPVTRENIVNYKGSKLLVVSKNTEGVVVGNIDLKMIFLGCK